MYILPIISLALPTAANLMKWLRRYTIDQMNSDYVRFARGSGLSEGQIFRTHVLKNAAIPMIHGIPASILGALVGAIITERVYVVPGAGNLLTGAINAYDNGVIVGVTLFYAVISVLSVILGDVLLAVMDPRISFGQKEG
jgi:oligopeptide transport system permease protein